MQLHRKATIFTHITFKQQQVYIMWKPVLSCKQWYVTLDAIYWQKFYWSTLNWSLDFGGFNTNTPHRSDWRLSCKRWNSQTIRQPIELMQLNPNYCIKDLNFCFGSRYLYQCVEVKKCLNIIGFFGGMISSCSLSWTGPSPILRQIELPLSSLLWAS